MVLSIAAMFSYGCDDTGDGTVSISSTGGVCGEAVRVSNTSSARLYYPCNISSPIGATTASSGYVGTKESVTWLSNRVAQAGFVVLAFTPTNQYGMVTGWRAAHKSSIAKLKELSNSGKLAGKIDTSKLQTCGHSKGGGGSLWAAGELGGQLRTAVGMAPYNGYPGTYEGPAPNIIGRISAATMIQAGSDDTLATNAMTRGEYRALGNISKKYYELNGYGHLAWASATGSRADRMAGDIIAWMRYYMNGDTSQRGVIANQSGAREFNWVDLTNGSGSGSGGGGALTGTAYSFINVNSGKALDVWEWGTAAGTNISQYSYWADEAEGAHPQKFYVQSANGGMKIIPTIATDMALDVVDGADYSGANIQIWYSNEYPAQVFQINSVGNAYQIKNAGSGMCVAIEGSSTEDGANVIQTTCNSSDPSQLFNRKSHSK